MLQDFCIIRMLFFICESTDTHNSITDCTQFHTDGAVFQHSGCADEFVVSLRLRQLQPSETGTVRALALEP